MSSPVRPAVPRGARRIRAPAACLLLVCVLLGLDLIGWLQLQRLLDRRLAVLVQQAQRAGWQLEGGASRRGGWPLGATLTLAAPRLQGGRGLLPGVPAGLSWTAERVTVSLSLLHPRRITILPGGVQVIRAADTRASGLGDSVRLWARRMRLELPASDRASGGEVRLAAGALHLALPGAGPGQAVTVGALHGTLRWTATARATTLALEAVGLPYAGDSVLSIPQAALELSLIGGGDSSRLLLRQAALRWDEAMIDASGQVRFDQHAQPNGSLILLVAGADRLLGRLATCKQISPSSRAAVQAVLGLIGQAQDAAPQPAPAGPAPARVPQAGLPPIELPLNLRAGLLSLGRIPLLQLPPLGSPEPVP